MLTKIDVWKCLTLGTTFALLASFIITLWVEWSPEIFPNSTFEDGTLLNWVNTGAAFANQPTLGDNPRQRGREGSYPQGLYWVGSFESCRLSTDIPGSMQGDAPVGELNSIRFLVRYNELHFLVGGGAGDSKTRVALVIDGKEVLVEQGNGKQLDSEKMRRVFWDVSAWQGRWGHLRITDESSGPWGHINVDDFRWSRTLFPSIQ